MAGRIGVRAVALWLFLGLVLAARPGLADPLAAFGGQPGLVRIVDTLMEKLLAHDQMRPFFIDVDRQRVKDKLVEQFCAELGGPCVYTGKDMRTAHAKQDIRMSDYLVLVGLLQEAMDQHRVPFADQNRLLAELAPMYRDMVGRPGK